MRARSAASFSTAWRRPTCGCRSTWRATASVRFDRLIEACDRDAACRAAFPSLRATVDRLWTQLAARPTVAFTHPRTGKPVTVTRRSGSSPRSCSSRCTRRRSRRCCRNCSPTPRTAATRGCSRSRHSADLPKGAMSEGMFLSVVCAEDMPRIAPEDIARETSGRFIGSTMFDTRMKPCEFWPRGAVADDYYEPVASSKPVLIFSGEDDPVTPPSWGEHVRQTLQNARHIVVPGAGHITLMRGCVPRLVATFLDDASVAGIDPACLGNLARPPFFTSYTGPERRGDRHSRRAQALRTRRGRARRHVHGRPRHRHRPARTQRRGKDDDAADAVRADASRQRRRSRSMASTWSRIRSAHSATWGCCPIRAACIRA